MSDRAIEIMRWVLLVGAVLNLLQATVLFRALQRLVIHPWLATGERLGVRAPALLRSERVQRVWALVSAAAFLGLWWYLGTPDGVEAVRRALH